MLSLEIETPRLKLRPALPGDAEAVTARINDPRVYRNLGRIPPGQSQDETRAFLESMRAGHAVGTDHVCLVEEGDRLVGCVGAHRSGGRMPFELGYWIAPEAWGHGFATEAAGALMGRLRDMLGVKAMTSGYFTDNPASGRVLRKLGFLPCGRRPYFSNGRETLADRRDMVWLA